MLLSDIEEIVLNELASEAGYAFIVSRDGEAIIHPRLQVGNLKGFVSIFSFFVDRFMIHQISLILYYWKVLVLIKNIQVWFFKIVLCCSKFTIFFFEIDEFVKLVREPMVRGLDGEMRLVMPRLYSKV